MTEYAPRIRRAHFVRMGVLNIALRAKSSRLGGTIAARQQTNKYR